MILEEGSSKGPHTSEDKVNLVKFSRGVRRSVAICQQAVQQGTQCLVGVTQEYILNLCVECHIEIGIEMYFGWDKRLSQGTPYASLLAPCCFPE